MKRNHQVPTMNYLLAKNYYKKTAVQNSKKFRTAFFLFSKNNFIF